LTLTVVIFVVPISSLSSSVTYFMLCAWYKPTHSLLITCHLQCLCPYCFMLLMLLFLDRQPCHFQCPNLSFTGHIPKFDSLPRLPLTCPWPCHSFCFTCHKTVNNFNLSIFCYTKASLPHPKLAC
jgi:hypothetical protein